MESIKVIDFHTHIYPWPKLSQPTQFAKSLIKTSLQPISFLQHELHAQTRKLPKLLRTVMDEVGTPLTVPHLIAESSIQDLQIEMQNNYVAKAIVMPHPPIMTNSFVHSECRGFSNLIPGVFLDPETITTTSDLDAFWKAGFRIYKVNPIQSGKAIKDSYYNPLIEFLVNKGAIIVLHSGNIESNLFFKLPQGGDIENYKIWLEQFPNGKFLAAHMNYHQPEKAIALANHYSNLSLICTWQPKNIIAEAIKTLGSEKVLFGSDWPLLGGNISYKKQQLLDLVREGVITRDEVENVFFKNAEKLLDQLSHTAAL